MFFKVVENILLHGGSDAQRQDVWETANKQTLILIPFFRS